MQPFADRMAPQQQQPLTWDQRILQNAGGRAKAALKPEYQELKFTLHRKLLDRSTSRRWPRSTTSACAAKCGRRWSR